MAAYWLIFTLFACISLVHNRDAVPAGRPLARGAAREGNGSIGFVLAGTFLTVVIGLRDRVGGDWSNYLRIFNQTTDRKLSDALATSTSEPGYAFLNWFAAQLGGGIWLVNLVCALLFTMGLIKLCRQQPNAWLAVVVATPFLVFVVAMGFTRQAAALGTLMIGCSHLIARASVYRFLKWVLFGALFHKTVLVFVPILLLAGTKKKGPAIFLALLAAVLGYLLVVRGGIESYGVGYIQADYDSAGATVRILMNILPAALLLIWGNKFYSTVEEKQVWRSFAILATGTGAALFLIQSSVIVDRLAMYLIPLQFFVYSRIPYLASKSGAVTWRALIILYSAVVLFVWLNYAVHAHAWIPYRNYLVSSF